jgi:muconolactone D-isomerase
MVEITVELPADMPPGERQQVREAELVRGRELLDAGAIKAIWRIPGGLHNVGIWEVADATELHAVLESLPLFPWLSAEVTALAEHPLSRRESQR